VVAKQPAINRQTRKNLILSLQSLEETMTYLRRLPRFEYFAPQTTEAVCELLESTSGEARLLAGGTDLILQMRHRQNVPRCIIGLRGIAELAYIHELAEGGLAIGAMTTIDSLLSSPILRNRYRVLCQTAADMGSPEIRNLATLGGNLAGALPCADFPPVLMTLGANVKLRSRHGERSVPVENLFPAWGQTVAEPNEILTEIQIPSLPPLSGGTYLKFHDRHSMDMTTLGVSAFLSWDESSRIAREVKIALASSGPVPMRARRAEAVLRGRDLAEEALEEAASTVCEEADPHDSWRATREFRMELLRTLTKRAIRGAYQQAVSSPQEGRA
jgi:aerobic carbon-monoxide dehydrogenase medium subunit